MGRAELRRKELEKRKRQKKARCETQKQLNESQTSAGLKVQKSNTASNSKSPFKTIQEADDCMVLHGRRNLRSPSLTKRL